ncbi:MAG: class I adenylate-forming enzyme family protein [Actinomycetaceae bacterium]|nr:class I adenylate-forming enzyme family protein [Actinomycetaceae bacterium]
MTIPPFTTPSKQAHHHHGSPALLPPLVAPDCSYGPSTFFNIAATTPHAASIVTRDHCYTRSEVAEIVTRYTKVLHSHSVHAQDIVALMAPNSPAHLCLYLACSMKNAVFTPIDPRLGPIEYREMLHQVPPRVIYQLNSTDGHTIAPLTTSFDENKVLAHTNLWQPLDTSDMSPLHFPVQPQSICTERLDNAHVLMWSSGTTGLAQPIALTWENIYSAWLNHRYAFGYRPRATVMTAAPLSHIGAFNGITLDAFVHGGCVVIPPDLRPHTLYHYMRQHRVECFFTVPAVIDMLLELPDFNADNLPALYAPVIGGSLMSRRICDELCTRGFHPIHVWGMTQTSGGAIYNDMCCASKSLSLTSPALGHPMKYSKVALYNHSTKSFITAPDISGEICVGGSNVCAGGGTHIGDYLFSGDIGSFDSTGALHFHGRSHDTIMTGGHSVHPVAVENVLRMHPAVEDAVVCGIPDKRWGYTVAALIVLAQGCHNGDAAQLQQHTNNHMAHYKTPRQIVFVNEIPLTNTGKPDRREALHILQSTLHLNQ